MSRPKQSFWHSRPVLITGGASFIGSHLADKIVQMGARVTIVDNLSSGTLENLELIRNKIAFCQMDLEYSNLSQLKDVFAGNEIVFHLAAVHGGRGYIQYHPAEVSSNFAIDHHVLDASAATDVEKVVFASSACVYPPHLQKNVGSKYLLREEDSDITDLKQELSADVEYGWAKLMGEVQLNAFVKQYGLGGCSLRFVTTYGPRENETHAIIALIYKALERMDPYAIWGDGEQERDFTYVSDIVEGTILAAERVRDGTAINLGTGNRFKLKDVAQHIFDMLDWHPQHIYFDTSRPVGVVSRALDISRANELLGWRPKVSLTQGLRLTIEHYSKNHSRQGRVDERILVEQRSNSHEVTEAPTGRPRVAASLGNQYPANELAPGVKR